ncbi:DUF7344 domain-containing protein [Haladaptatus sp. NG-WS-4]
MSAPDSLTGRSDSLSTAFDALSNEHRRRILFELLAENPQEFDVAIPQETDEESRRNAELMLTNVHLPKLEDYGYVEWDREAGEVTKGAQFDDARFALELVSTGVPEPLFSRSR